MVGVKARTAQRRHLQHQEVTALWAVDTLKAHGHEVVFVVAWAVLVLPPQVVAFKVRELQPGLAGVPIAARPPTIQKAMGEFTAQQRRLKARGLEPLHLTPRPTHDTPRQGVQLATDAVSHARRGRFVRVAVDDGQQLATVLGGDQVMLVDLKVLPWCTGLIGTGHVFTPSSGFDQQPASLGGIYTLGVNTDVALQLFTDTHDYLELAIRLAPIDPPKRRVLPRSLQLPHRPLQRSSAGLSVGSSFLVSMPAPV